MEKTGVDLKQLKKWIEKNYGTKCKKFAFMCPCCEAWRIYQLLKEIIEL